MFIEGLLGDGSTVNQNIPVVVENTDLLGGVPVKRVSPGRYVTCVITIDGRAWCWGRNFYGQLGNGTTGSNSSVPVLAGTSGLTPLELIVTLDIDGAPAECTNVKVASDGKSLTCTTSAHPAGWVDVTIDDGITTKTLTDGYEYVEDYEGDDDDDNDKPGTPGGTLIDKLLAPDTGVGKAIGWIVLGEVVFVAAGIAVFFRLKKA